MRGENLELFKYINLLSSFMNTETSSLIAINISFKRKVIPF